ncbi:MAG TPA: hypothetical protein VEK08_10120 [Planctomycetota bacterium]|nr:hypothetical protein [Planctomycetota bacterium]
MRVTRALLFVASLLSAFGARGVAGEQPAAANENKPSVAREAMVDFVDDALLCGREITAADIDALMIRLKELGISRVSWSYYGDERGGYLTPSGFEKDYNGGWKHLAATYRNLGNPLKVAVEAGHRHGLEVYAYFKPYETGPGVTFPEGSPEAKQWGLLECVGGRLAWMDPFVREHPELRIKRRADDPAGAPPDAPIVSLRLIKKDATPTRIKKENLQIWTSPDNFRYQRKPVEFSLSETVEPTRAEVRDHAGNLLTRKGDSVRVLTLSGLNLMDKYVLVTTDFTAGKPDFVNSGTAILSALDEAGREIPGVFATGRTVWCASLMDFRNGGLSFDYGWGAMAVTLDAPNTDGKTGIVAFARGRNEYLPGALCETEPAVQKFWLQCIDAMIAAGVDGIDFREENHSTHTDRPQDYGFNAAVLEKCKGMSGEITANIAKVRGAAYTDFLRSCKRKLQAAGKRMRYNLQMDFFRPVPPPERLLAYPANIHFDWKTWTSEKLMDGAILRFFSLPFKSIFDDATTQEMIARCKETNLPLYVNRYVKHGNEQLAAELQRIENSGRFSGFIFYEVSDFIKFGKTPGTCEISYPPVLKATGQRK